MLNVPLVETRLPLRTRICVSSRLFYLEENDSSAKMCGFIGHLHLSTNSYHRFQYLCHGLETLEERTRANELKSPSDHHFVLLIIFCSFLHSLLPFRHIDSPGKFPIIRLLIVPSTRRLANYLFVRLNVNLGLTLDDLFVWTNEMSSKNRLHRRTNRRTKSED